jgi:hypothetical protein
MTEYINKKVYKDTKSYKVLEKDDYNGVATVIEVEKIPNNLIWENRKCVNAKEAFENAPITEVKNAKPFQIFKNKNGIWGIYKKVGHNVPRKIFEATNMKNTVEYEYSEDGNMVIVYESNKNGKIKTIFEKFGDIENTCKYFYDYNS